MLLTILAALIIIALIVWAVPQLLEAIGVPPPVARVIYVGLVCLVVIGIVSLLLGHTPSFSDLRR